MAKPFVQGAFVTFAGAATAAPQPSVITFPFNPDTITHTLTAATGAPAETYSFTMVVDDSAAGAAALAAPSAPPPANAVQQQLSALEALLWPAAGSQARLPVLFVWGAQRAVPVWVTAFTATETRFDTQLNTTQAEVQVALAVLDAADIAALAGPLAAMARTAADQRAAARAAALTQAQMPASADGSAPSLAAVLHFLT